MDKKNKKKVQKRERPVKYVSLIERMMEEERRMESQDNQGYVVRGYKSIEVLA